MLPRRRAVMPAAPERRRVVDRRRAPLLHHLAAQAEATGDTAADLAAVVARLERALNTLEHRPA